MIDEFVPEIVHIQSEGAVVLIRWDGERSSNRCSVVINRKDTDYTFRLDSDSFSAALIAGLEDYRKRHNP